MVWARACGRGLLGVLARWALGAERLACARAQAVAHRTKEHGAVREMGRGCHPAAGVCVCVRR